MLQLLWNQLVYQGVLYVSNITEHKHIVLVNTLSLFIPVFTVINLAIVVSIGIPPFYIFASLSYMILLPFTIAFNAYGKILFARVYLFFLSLGYLILLAFMQGNQARVHFFLLSEALVAYFIFPAHQKKIMHWLIGILFAIFIVLDFMHDDMVGIITQSSERIKIANIVTNLLAF